MTKEEIVKALRYCADGESCIDCIYLNIGLPYLPCNQKDKDAADLIEAQAAEIEKLKAEVPRRIPCSERLPEPGERVLATDGGFIGEMYINKRGQWRRYNVAYIEDLMALDILWWMPLPEVEA